MSCLGSCCRGMFLSLLSIITCGVLFVGTVAVVIFEKKKRFDEVSKTVFIVSIVVCVLCGLLLLFAIYASCCGKQCAKGVLGFVFIIFMLILIACAVCIWVLRDRILTWIGNHYEEKELWKVVPSVVNCCQDPSGWDTCQDPTQKPCRSVFDDFLRKFGNVVGACLVVLAVLLLIGAIVACAYKKCGHSSGGITYNGP